MPHLSTSSQNSGILQREGTPDLEIDESLSGRRERPRTEVCNLPDGLNLKLLAQVKIQLKLILASSLAIPVMLLNILISKHAIGTNIQNTGNTRHCEISDHLDTLILGDCQTHRGAHELVGHQASCGLITGGGKTTGGI